MTEMWTCFLPNSGHKRSASVNLQGKDLRVYLSTRYTPACRGIELITVRNLLFPTPGCFWSNLRIYAVQTPLNASWGIYVKAQALLTMIVLASRIRAMLIRLAPSLLGNFSDRIVMQVVCIHRRYWCCDRHVWRTLTWHFSFADTAFIFLVLKMYLNRSQHRVATCYLESCVWTAKTTILNTAVNLLKTKI